MAFWVLLLSKTIQAATITSMASGYWNDVGTWISGTIPSSTDCIVIASGHEVLFDRNDNSTTCSTVEIRVGGKLKYTSTPSDQKTMQVKGDVKVYGTLELVPGSTLKMECETNGQYGIIVYSGGELKGTGSVPIVLTTLSAPLNIGDQSITVTNGTGFGVGDIITLGDGANAEGFTISAISGTTITLNRRALNAQVADAEVYKNATITTAPISAGSRTFTVADVGGIKAGDKIAIIMDDKYQVNEIRTVESTTANQINITHPFLYAHPLLGMVVKLNRNTIISSAVKDDSHNPYIKINSRGAVNLYCVEMSYFGGNWGTYALEFVAGATPPTITRSAFNNLGREVISNNGNGSIVVSNSFVDCVGGLYFQYSTKNNIIISNIFFAKTYGANQLMVYGEGSLLANNVSVGFSPGSGISSGDKNLLMFNKSAHNWWGIWINRNSIAYSNQSDRNRVGFVSRSSDGELTILSSDATNCDMGIGVESFGATIHTIDSNIFAPVGVATYQLQNGAKIDLRNTLINLNYDSSLWTSYYKQGISSIGKGIISLRHNGIPALMKISGDLHISALETERFNYTNQSYPSSATSPILFRGSSHAITTPETSDITTTTEVWFVTYRSATANWEVKGTVSSLQVNRASSGVPYTSDNGQVRFTLTQAGGVQEGDQFVFATIAAAGDANTQKKIIFGPSAIAELNNRSRLTVDPGGKLELIGTPEYPTLIDYDGTGDYGLVVSGEVKAQYFDINQVNSDGVKINPTATITNFDNGNIRNVSWPGPHLSVSGENYSFNMLNFDNTGAVDVQASNNAQLNFIRSQRGKFLDSIFDTSTVTWDDPIIGYTSDYITGPLAYNVETKIITVPFKIKDASSSVCTFKSGSFQYSQDAGNTWRTVADTDLSGIGEAFSSSSSFATAVEHSISWNTGTNYNNLEANLKVRFRVHNGYVYGNYGSSEVFPFNIKPPVVKVIFPNGGELFKGGVIATIQWTATDEGSGVAENAICIYGTYGTQEVLLAQNIPNTGSYNVSIPTWDLDNVKIKITAYDKVGERGEDSSDGTFTIDSTPPPAPTVNSVKSPTLLATQRLSGSKAADAAHIFINGTDEAVNYPDSTSWNCLVNLVKGQNSFLINASDAAGNQSSTVCVTIEARELTFTSENSLEVITFPVGSTTKEVSFVYFSRVGLPGAPMRGAKAVEPALQIVVYDEDGGEIESLEKEVFITMPYAATVANPKIYGWNSVGRKWILSWIIDFKIDKNSLNFKCSKITTFALFDVVDLTPPQIGNVKVNNLKVNPNDSISDLPEIGVDISDDYGLEKGAMSLSVDGGGVQSLSAMQALSIENNDVISSGTFKYKETQPLPVGPHTFVITATDEVGNSTAYSIPLYVIGSTIPGLMVYPNPYKLGSTTPLKFDGLSGDVDIFIYDVAGDLVWKGFTSGAASITWGGINQAGNAVCAGVYYYIVKNNNGGKTVGQIAVIK